MKKILSFLSFSLLIPFIALSQWSTDPSVNNPINTLSGEQAIPKIATCSNGDTYIASFSNESGNYNVRMQRLNAQGVAQWITDGILISDNPQDSWLTDWDMTADNANHAILVFPDIRNGGANVVAYRISPAGSFVWGAEGIVLSTGDGNYSPKVTTTAAGNAIVAWSQEDEIHVQKISAAGSLPWGSGITISQTGITFSWPQLMPVGSDEFIMKYYQDSGTFPAITRHIYAQKYNAGGTAVWSSPAAVSIAGGIAAWTQVLPFISDGSGGFYIAWHDDRDNNMLSSTWVNHVNSEGIVQFTTNGVEASTQGGRNHFYPELALPPGSSNVFVFWNEMDADQNNRGIYGQKLTSTGTRLWATSGMVFIELSMTDVYPEAARHSPTDVVVFYSQQVSGLDYQLKAFRVDTDGGYMWTPNHKMICSVASEKVHVVTNNFANNQWIMSWEDDRDGDKDIYAQNIQLDGSLGPYDPQEGTIEGTVTLVGGSASVTQVAVTAGDVTVNPDATGFYSMVVPHGTYAVIGNLTGYIPDTAMNVVVVTGQTTENVDLTLEALPTGFISGNVVLSGGAGNVADVEVVAGYHVVNPDSEGNYTMEIEIGTYDVTAQLEEYLPDTDSGIVVFEGMTTAGVNFILDPVPTTGFISGNVQLAGGTGDVTDVEVTAGDVTVNPDSDGNYLLEIVAGTYEVSASLTGYYTGAVQNVVVLVEQTTPDVDFILYPIPDVGYIQGHVTLVNGEGDVTQGTVSAGGQETHPSDNGSYVLSVSAGTYTVTADHPYTDADSLTSIVVVAGQNTDNVDFELEINRANLVVFALDQYNNPLNGLDVEITGPEGILSGTIVDDVLVFENQPYGFYDGYAYMEGNDPEYAYDTLEMTDQDLVFYFLNVGIKDHSENNLGLDISPNPSGGNVKISLILEEAGMVSVKVYSQQGQMIKSVLEDQLTRGLYNLEWNGTNEEGNYVPAGMYVLVVRTPQGKSASVMIRK